MAVVPGAGAQEGRVAHPLPPLAAVIGAEEAAVLRLDNCPDAIAPRGAGDADLAEDARRQAGLARQFRPGIAAIGRLPDAGVLAAADQLVRVALRLPDGGVEDARIIRVHRDVVRTRPVALAQHEVPRLAAILRAIDTALRVRPPGVAEGRDIDDVRVLRMDADFADMAGRGEAHIAPRLAAVGGLIDAIPMRDITANRRLAHPRIDDVRVGLGDGNRADRRRGEEAVRDVAPGRAAVIRLPDAARARAVVIGHRVRHVARHRHAPPAPMRPDAPPFQRFL